MGTDFPVATSTGGTVYIPKDKVVQITGPSTTVGYRAGTYVDSHGTHAILLPDYLLITGTFVKIRRRQTRRRQRTRRYKQR